MTTITPWEKRIGASNDWDEFIQALKAEIAELRAFKERVESQEPVGEIDNDNIKWYVKDEALENIDGLKIYVLPPVNAGLVEAAQNAIGCFNAASFEGLDQALAETADERLKDLVERRLLHAPGPLADALLQSSQPESRTRADGMSDSKTLAWSFRLSKPTLARSS